MGDSNCALVSMLRAGEIIVDNFAGGGGASLGKPLTKTAQVRLCGNSVCPPVAAAVIAANFASGETYAESVA